MRTAGKMMIFALTMIFILSTSGCGIKTYVFEKERVDQEIIGNRGVLLGSVPPPPKAEAPAKMTIIGVDVDLPHISLQRKAAARPGRETTPDKDLWGNKGYISSKASWGKTERYPYEAEKIERVSLVEKPSKASVRKEEYFIEYQVKKGDTLSSIAAKDEVYSDAGKWKKIYEANRDVVKDPARLYPGQILKIPMGGEEKEAKRERIK